jgi:hypothetical protein
VSLVYCPIHFLFLILSLLLCTRTHPSNQTQINTLTNTHARNRYDLDGSGGIDRQELFNIMSSSLRMKGTLLADEAVWAMVEQCFAVADADGNGALDFEEFKMAIMQQKVMLQSFWQV